MNEPTLNFLADPALEQTRAQSDQEQSASSSLSNIQMQVPGYALHEKLGEGGMGVVFKATQIKLNRTVALKMIIGRGSASSRELIRFLVEAEAVAAIDHPHVVKVYDSGDAHGSPYIAMEYLPGGSLSDRLKAKQLTTRETVDLMRKIALAVQAAHDRQIVHRDLKPANVMFDAAGEPRVLDFGLAKRTGQDLTNTNAIMGTPAYMAPEQARGEGKFVGPTADVWALGVMLYEGLSGAKPFGGSGDFEIIKNVIEQEPSSICTRNTTLPRDLDLITRKCLSKQPSERYSSAREFAEDLANWLDGKPISVKPATSVERLVKWTRRNKIATSIIAASLFCVMGTSYLAWKAFQEQEKATFFAARATEESENVSRASDALKLKAEEINRANDTLQKQSREQRYLVDVLRIRDAVNGFDDNFVDYSLSTLQEVLPENRSELWCFARRRCYGSDIILSVPGATIHSAVWHPDGQQMATGDSQSHIILWDLKTGQRTRTITGHTGAVTTVAWISGDRLASASRDRTVQIWNLSDGSSVQTLSHPGEVFGLKIHAKTSRLASASSGAIRIWNVETGQLLQTLTVDDPQPCVEWSPDGGMIATSGLKSPVVVWNIRTGEKIRTLTTRHGGTCGNLNLSWSAQNNMLAAGTEDGRIRRLWKIDDAENLRDADPPVSMISPNDAYRSVASWSHDGSILALSPTYDTITLQNPAQPTVTRTIFTTREETCCIDWSPDDRKICYGCDDGSVHIIDLEDYATKSRVLGRGLERINVVRWLSNGKLYAGGVSSHVHTWEESEDFKAGPPIALPAGQQLAMISPVLARLTLEPVSKSAREFEVRAWDAEGIRVAVASQDHGIVITGAPGDATRKLPAQKSQIRQLAFHPSGKVLASVNEERDIILWDLETLKPLREFNGHDGHVLCLQWSPDGKYLASGSEDNTIRIWDPLSGLTTRTLQGKRGSVNALIWSPDGCTLAAARSNGLIRLWNVPTGLPVLEFDAHAGHVRSIAFSPDGNSLLSGGDDGVVRLWESLPYAIFPEIVISKGSEKDGFVYHPLAGGKFLKVPAVIPAQEQKRRERILRSNPVWHAEQATACESRHDWFAAVFHWRWVMKGQPSDETAKRLKAAEAKLP